MITAELLEYIKQSLSAGQSEAGIETLLLEQGWSKDDVSEALGKVKANSSALEPNLSTSEQLANLSEPSSQPTGGVIKSRKTLWLSVAAVVFLLLAGSASAYFFWPPKPETVVSQMLVNMAEVKTYNFQSSINGNVTAPDFLSSLLPKSVVTNQLLSGQVAGITSSELKFQIRGSVDRTNDNYTQAQGTLGLNVLNNSLGLDFLAPASGDVYLKINQAPNIPMFDLENIKNIWIQIATKEEIEKFYEKTKIESEEITAEQEAELADLYNKMKPVLIAQKLEDAKIDDVSVYHYQYHIDKEQLKLFILEMGEILKKDGEKNVFESIKNDEVFEGMSFSDGEIWIGKKDKYLYKISGGISAESTSTQPGSGSVTWEMQFSNFNEPMNISAPAEFKTSKEIVPLLLGQQITKSNDARRLADVHSIRVGLELYYDEHGKYPDKLSDTDEYFNHGSNPVAPFPPDGDCSEQDNTYTYKVLNQGTDYEVSFCLGGEASGYSAGKHILTFQGIK